MWLTDRQKESTFAFIDIDYNDDYFIWRLDCLAYFLKSVARLFVTIGESLKMSFTEKSIGLYGKKANRYNTV